MKVFLALLAVVAAVSASEIDWSKVKPIEEFPGFWKGRESLQKLYEFQKSRTQNSRQTPDSRVTGGQIATPHQFPYQVAILAAGADGVGLCGGSIINARTILVKILQIFLCNLFLEYFNP